MAVKADLVPAELRVRSGDATVRLQLQRGPMFARALLESREASLSLSSLSLSSPQRRPPRPVAMASAFPPAPRHRQRVRTERALRQRYRTLIKSTFREWGSACHCWRLEALEREVQLLRTKEVREISTQIQTVSAHKRQQATITVAHEAHSQPRAQQAEATAVHQQLEQELARASRVGEQEVRLLRDELASARAQSARADAEACTLRAEVGAAKEQVAKLTVSHESCEAELKAYRQDVAANESRYVADVMDAENQRKAQATECERLRHQLAQAERSLQTEAQQCAELVADLASERDSVAVTETAIREQCRHELAEQSQTANRRMGDFEKMLEQVRHEHRVAAVESQDAQRHLATLSALSEELEQKLIATSRNAAEQLASAEEIADQRVSDIERLVCRAFSV